MLSVTHQADDVHLNKHRGNFNYPCNIIQEKDNQEQFNPTVLTQILFLNIYHSLYLIKTDENNLQAFYQSNYENIYIQIINL